VPSLHKYFGIYKTAHHYSHKGDVIGDVGLY